MRWPFVTRRVFTLELDNAHRGESELRLRLAQAEEREKYWRERFERLADAALAKAGAIHEPTMVERKPPAPSHMEVVSRAMSVREIESGKKTVAG